MCVASQPFRLSPPLQVLITSENITKRLATEKACSWLMANITGRRGLHALLLSSTLIAPICLLHLFYLRVLCVCPHPSPN